MLTSIARSLASLLPLALALHGCNCGGGGGGGASAEAEFAQVSLNVGQSVLAYAQGRPLPADGRFVCADQPTEYAQDYTVGMQLPADARVAYVASTVNAASYAGATVLPSRDQMSSQVFVSPDGRLSYTSIRLNSGMPEELPDEVLDATFPEALGLSRRTREIMLQPGCDRPRRLRAQAATELGLPASFLGTLSDVPDSLEAYECEHSLAMAQKEEPYHLRDEVRMMVGIVSTATLVNIDAVVRRVGERSCILITGATRHDPSTGQVVPWRQTP